MDTCGNRKLSRYDGKGSHARETFLTRPASEFRCYPLYAFNLEVFIDLRNRVEIVLIFFILSNKLFSFYFIKQFILCVRFSSDSFSVYYMS